MSLLLIPVAMRNCDAFWDDGSTSASHPNDAVACQGHYDPRQTKVLQYRFNPFSVAQRKLTADLDELREENRRLTKRLQIVEESRGAAVSDLSARVDSELQASSGKEVEGIMALYFFVLQVLSLPFIPTS